MIAAISHSPVKEIVEFPGEILRGIRHLVHPLSDERRAQTGTAFVSCPDIVAVAQPILRCESGYIRHVLGLGVCGGLRHRRI